MAQRKQPAQDRLYHNTPCLPLLTCNLRWQCPLEQGGGGGIGSGEGWHRWVSMHYDSSENSCFEDLIAEGFHMEGIIRFHSFPHDLTSREPLPTRVRATINNKKLASYGWMHILKRWGRIAVDLLVILMIEHYRSLR